jgi:hypothetical protein
MVDNYRKTSIHSCVIFKYMHLRGVVKLCAIKELRRGVWGPPKDRGTRGRSLPEAQRF